MLVFRARPGDGDAGIATEGFDFSAVCRTCPGPPPLISGHATKAQSGVPRSSGDFVTFAAQVTFPAAGSWWITAPFEAPIEVR